MTTEAENAFGFRHIFERGGNPDGITLLLLHGTGGDERDLVPLGRALSPGASLLSPRGNVSENGAPRFFRRFAEGVFDLADLANRTAELATFASEASAAYGLDTKRLIAVGFSNGANIAASLLFRSPATVGGAILLRAMLPFVPNETPKLEGKPILMLAGVSDPVMPPAQVEELASLLQKAGADVNLHWVKAGHALSAEDVKLAGNWLRGTQAKL